MVSGRSRVPLPPARRIAFMSVNDHTIECATTDEPAQYVDTRADVSGTAARCGTADRVRGPTYSGHAEGAGGRCDLRAGLGHGLARRLSRAPASPGHLART